MPITITLPVPGLDTDVWSTKLNTALTALVNALNALEAAANAKVSQATLDAALATTVTKAAYNAQSVLVAVSDDTPVPVTFSNSTVLGRGATGNVRTLSAGDLKSILGMLLTELADVEVTGGTDGHVLTWAAGLGKFVLAAPQGGTGGGGSTTLPTWVTNATVIGQTLVQAPSQSEARAAIGATSLVLGTTADTAKPGNYAPNWTDVQNRPTTFAPIIGTTATTAKAGNYVPTKADVGLGNVDNTSDANKPVSSAVAAAIAAALIDTPVRVSHDGVTQPVRPNTLRPVLWITPDNDRPASGGTTGGGTYAAVNGLDILGSF